MSWVFPLDKATEELEHHGKSIYKKKKKGCLWHSSLFLREIPETIISYPKLWTMSDIVRLKKHKTKASEVLEFVSVHIDKFEVQAVSLLFIRR